MVNMDIKNEMHFSPSVKLGDLNENNVIEAFKERIEEWYIKPMCILNKKKLGFASVALIASLIDILAKTENHDITNNGNRLKYKEWLKKKFKFTEADALNFYDNFRCGLLHAGCIESGGYISYDQGQFYMSNNGSLIVNPKLLSQKVCEKFNEFIENENPKELFTYLKGKLYELQ